MSVTLRVLLVIGALVTTIWILRKIRKMKVKMEDAIFWMCFAGVLMILALFPEISYKLTTMFGVMSPANLIFLIMICILFEKVFTLSILVSQLEEKVTILSAEVALRSHGAEDEIKKLQEEKGIEEKDSVTHKIKEENAEEKKQDEEGEKIKPL